VLVLLWICIVVEVGRLVHRKALLGFGSQRKGGPSSPRTGTLEQEYWGTCDICGKEADAAVEVSSGFGMLTLWPVQQHYFTLLARSFFADWPSPQLPPWT
jgi:hypothetical protein